MLTLVSKYRGLLLDAKEDDKPTEERNIKIIIEFQKIFKNGIDVPSNGFITKKD